MTRAPLSGNGLSQEMARRTGNVSNTTKHSTTSTSLSSLAPLVQALSLPPPQQSTVPKYTYNSPSSSIDHYKKSTINTSFVFPTSLDTTGSYLTPPYSNKCKYVYFISPNRTRVSWHFLTIVKFIHVLVKMN